MSRKFISRQNMPQIKPRFIHLIRDGRAVTASMLRKKRHRSMFNAARVWRHNVNRDLKLLRSRPKAEVLTVRYESVLHDTVTELTRICDFLGISYSPSMLNYHQIEQHYLGGNPGTLTSVANHQGREIAEMPADGSGPDQWDLAKYRQASTEQFHIELWRTQLSPRDLKMFKLVAGLTNRRIGYPGWRS